MSDEAFKGYLSQFRNEDGEVFIGETRYMIMPIVWLKDIQLELENLMGPSGTFALFDTASRRTAPSERALAAIKDLPFEHKIGAFFAQSALSGFGKCEPIEISKKPFKVVFKSPSSIFAEAYEGKADSPRCYLFASFIPYMEAIAKQEGLDIKLRVDETQCVAMGAPHCVVAITEDTGDSW